MAWGYAAGGILLRLRRQTRKLAAPGTKRSADLKSRREQDREPMHRGAGCGKKREGDGDEAMRICGAYGSGSRGDVRGAGNHGRISCESRFDDGERPVDAIPKEYGGGGGLDARGEIQLQANGGNEHIRSPDDAHRHVQQFSVLEDFGTGGAEGRAEGHGFKREAGGGAESLFRILQHGAGGGGRFETGRFFDALWKPADVARRRAHHLE